MEYNLDNKKVLITGASGGIGTSLCDKFIENKCKIIFTSSNYENLKNLEKKYGDDHSYYFMDMSNIDTISTEMEKITNENKDGGEKRTIETGKKVNKNDFIKDFIKLNLWIILFLIFGAVLLIIYFINNFGDSIKI